MDEVRGVTVTIAAPAGGPRYEGAAVLRQRPHPLARELVWQLGVPDDALGFRPRPDGTYSVHVHDAPGRPAAEYRSCAVWLERVQSSWWFILEAPAG